MMRRAVGIWTGFLVLCATGLMGAVLLVSGPAAAQPDYGPASGAGNVTATTVAPVAAPASAPIAFTGADIAAMAAVGAVAIGVGGTIVLVTRRRRSELA